MKKAHVRLFQARQFLQSSLMRPADFYYVGTPDVTVRDVVKLKRLSQAVSDMLHARIFK